MKNTGTVYVGCKVENHKDPKKVAVVPKLLVDSGSMFTWIAESILRELGIEPVKKAQIETASGQIVTRPVGFAILRVDEFETVDEVVFARKGDLLRLGWRALTGMNARVDKQSKRLVYATPVLAAGSRKVGRVTPCAPSLVCGRAAGRGLPALSWASVVSLTPWLQPGVKRNRETQNRFNGFSSRAEAVETAGDFPAGPVHRAEATVLMRTGN